MYLNYALNTSWLFKAKLVYILSLIYMDINFYNWFFLRRVTHMIKICIQSVYDCSNQWILYIQRSKWIKNIIYPKCYVLYIYGWDINGNINLKAGPGMGQYSYPLRLNYSHALSDKNQRFILILALSLEALIE